MVKEKIHGHRLLQHKAEGAQFWYPGGTTGGMEGVVWKALEQEPWNKTGTFSWNPAVGKSPHVSDPQFSNL
jgi:hypothetical protein